MSDIQTLLAQLRALVAATSDPEHRAQLEAQIAQLEAGLRSNRTLDAGDTAQIGLANLGDVGGDINAPIIPPGASGIGVGTVHQHFYPSLPPDAPNASQTLRIIDVRLEKQGDGYVVRAAAPWAFGDPAAQPFSLPLDPGDRAARRSDVASWVAQARVVRRRRPEELRKARELGQLLFRHLFNDAILAAFAESRGKLRAGEHLRIRLSLPPELATLPWELLNDPRSNNYLALEPNLSLVRYVELPQPAGPLLVQGPLQVLIVAASPQGGDYPVLHVDRELRRIERALQNSVSEGLIRLDVLRGAGTRDRLRDWLRDGTQRPVHMLHLICHGDFDEQGDHAVFVFEDVDRRPQPTPAAYLARLLSRQRGQTRLVLINACQGALPAGDDPSSSLAGTLLRAGVPAVLAMQFDIPDEAAAELARVFYGELAAGVAVDQALSEARAELMHNQPNRLDWLVPVLFLRANDERLFVRAPASRPAGEPEAGTPAVASAEPEPKPATPPAHLVSALSQAEREQLRLQALTAYYTRDWAQAAALLQRLVEADSSDKEARGLLEEARHAVRLQDQYALARQLRTQNDWRAVLKLLEAIVAERADFPDDDNLRAWAETEQRRQERYSAALTAAGRRDWGDVARLLVELLAEYPDDEAARKLLERARAEQFGAVHSMLVAGRFDEALVELRSRLNANPADKNALQTAVAVIEDTRFTIPVTTRIACGELLAGIGDPRLPLSREQWQAAGDYWRRFPAARFGIGITEAEYQQIIEEERANNLADEAKQWYENAVTVNTQAVNIEAFELARYPVTNAQFAQFINEGGYDPAAPWWAEVPGGLEWLKRNSNAAPEYWSHSRYGQRHANQPVVGVSWYEAMAFCQWLTGYLADGYVYRLPSEAEWEYAARGAARRSYAWGDQPPDPERANFNSTYGGPTPVGCFPSGATPEGLFDITGNVWEWTRSAFRPYPYDPQDGREDNSDTAQKSFTVRGDAWYGLPLSLRAAGRTPYDPAYLSYGLGLRLARHLSV